MYITTKLREYNDLQASIKLETVKDPVAEVHLSKVHRNYNFRSRILPSHPLKKANDIAEIEPTQMDQKHGVQEQTN